MQIMSMSTYYRAQAQRCLALSRACADRRHEAQLTFMANRYFERAGELEQETCPGAHPPSATQVRSATVRRMIGARAVTALVSGREDVHRDRSLARALLRAQSIGWP